VLQIADGDGLSEFQFQSLLDEGHGRTPDWGIGRGNHTIRACIDSSNIVSEANEDNNCWGGVVTRRESTPGPLPDLKIEPAWDDDIPWSYYLGSENKPSFNIVNIGGELPEDCRLNCSYFTWVDEGTNESKKITYSFSTINEMKMSDLFAGNTTNWGVSSGGLYGEHTLRACIDAMDYVDESNEDNNCWEGNLTVLPDLRWYQGNPEGTSESWLTARNDDESSDPIWENDFFIQDDKLRIETAYQCAVNSTYGNCSYGGNFIQMSVTVDGEEIDWWNMSAKGANIEAGESGWLVTIESSSLVRVCFDPNNLIQETNEDNNCIEKTLVNLVTDSDREMTDERSKLPALSVSLTLGILALAAITSGTQRKTKK
jgi:subtilase family serine protease